MDLSKFFTLVAGVGSVRTTLGIDPGDVVVTCVAEFSDNKTMLFS